MSDQKNKRDRSSSSDEDVTVAPPPEKKYCLCGDIEYHQRAPTRDCFYAFGESSYEVGCSSSVPPSPCKFAPSPCEFYQMSPFKLPKSRRPRRNIPVLASDTEFPSGSSTVGEASDRVPDSDPSIGDSDSPKRISVEGKDSDDSDRPRKGISFSGETLVGDEDSDITVIEIDNDDPRELENDDPGELNRGNQGKQADDDPDSSIEKKLPDDPGTDSNNSQDARDTIRDSAPTPAGSSPVSSSRSIQTQTVLTLVSTVVCHVPIDAVHVGPLVVLDVDQVDDIE